VLHLHDLDHVQIRFGRGLVDGEDGIDDVGCEALSKAGAQLGGERCPGDGKEQLAVDFTGELELVEELRQSAWFTGPGAGKQRTLSASTFAISKPSVIMRGWRPSWM
jgi:hypothetical protein